MGSKGLFSGFQKQRFGIFQAAVSQWLGHKTCWGSAFSHARPKHVFHGFCLVACGLSSLTLRKGLPCLRQLFFFVFSRFQKQRFGIFLAAVSHGLGTISLFLVGSKSDISGFFRLQFRNGLGTKPAGVLLFRMRVPNTFFLSLLVACRLPSLTLRKGLPCGFAWLGHDFFVFSGFQKQRFGIFPAAVSQWLGHSLTDQRFYFETMSERF